MLNITLISLAVASISSFFLTILPKTEDYDVLIAGTISLTRKRANSKARTFYRIWLLLLGLGFAGQFISEVLREKIIWTDAVANILYAALFCSLVLVIAKLRFQPSLRKIVFKLYYAPQFTDTNAGADTLWLYIIVNTSYDHVYREAKLVFPDRVSKAHIHKEGEEIKSVTGRREIEIGDLNPRQKIHVRAYGLGASDVSGTGQDAFLEVRHLKRQYPRLIGPASLDDY